ncbi:LOW QUALITY PROTEIN: F-box only protein 13 [Dioscorea cayenensis subsp. rotundata]|uniref:LOW QUALITY PROTEIN: F-box only protein 13 n=1 Tax=Dioscorea cayennensis subsp. rotundata TaxID=55577 RepID=A0AB40CWF8_DIOCR|nr:LOW QUALITY PROTEIN: F-box only protein 13 [Dioscorea cayenensis subsp. rotundata]
MELDLELTAGKNKKRKATEDAQLLSVFSLNELNEDLLERILAWLPASSFFRLRSVCKRWNSIASSATFQIACSQIPFRDPWFLMVDQELNQSVVFDATEWKWRNINHPYLMQDNLYSKPIPVASCGGLVCFRTISGDFIVSNPVTGVSRELPPVTLSSGSQTLHAIAMNSSPKDQSYRIVLVFGELSKLAAKVFDAAKGSWEDEVMLVRKVGNSSETEITGDEPLYFLSKSGDVVATNMQRSPSKQYSSVLINDDGEVVYFLSHTGTVIACNLADKTFIELPRLLPVYSEYSIDLVEYQGEMAVVILSEFLESASLRVWRFSKDDRSWQQVAVMPPRMSHEFYGKKADINCVSSADKIFICINSSEFSRHVVCDIVTNKWVELPQCYVNGKAREFMSALSFEPRVEASV